MDAFWQEVGVGTLDWPQLTRIGLRLVCAVTFAGLLGYERERKQRPAGLRTHMLVALGSAMFTIVPIEAGASAETLSRLVQGLAAGVGFLGAGAILKRDESKHVHGLTTAASIWMVAAIGFATGAGWIGLAILGTALTYLILAVLGRIEDQVAPPHAD
jgi:putative Mg2+ transporter-C (MgtC) family protein